MIHDATVEVTCDGDRCTESVMISPEYTYRTYSEHSGSYDTSDEAIERKLEAEGWAVEDGKHFCESCAEEVAKVSVNPSRRGRIPRNAQMVRLVAVRRRELAIRRRIAPSQLRRIGQ